MYVYIFIYIYPACRFLGLWKESEWGAYLVFSCSQRDSPLICLCEGLSVCSGLLQRASKQTPRRLFELPMTFLMLYNSIFDFFRMSCKELHVLESRGRPGDWVNPLLTITCRRLALPCVLERCWNRFRAPFWLLLHIPQRYLSRFGGNLFHFWVRFWKCCWASCCIQSQIPCYCRCI